MTLFKYVAISHNGMKIRGNVEAENIREARYILYQRKISILSIKVRRATDNSMVMSFLKQLIALI